MPSLTRWLNSLSMRDTDQSYLSSGSGSSSQEIKNKNDTTSTFFLAPFKNKMMGKNDDHSTHLDHTPLLFSTPAPNKSQNQPSGSIHFGLIHPDLHEGELSRPTGFFFNCLPDPIGYLAHSARFIKSHFDHDQDKGGIIVNERWRHDKIQLILKDEPGLAYTSSGDINVSLQWIGDVMRDVQSGGRSMTDAVKEFKGVLLHELVHAIQHDGYGSTPTWLIESIADYIRLKAHLGPPHWRHPGQGRKDKGWEEGYDSGAQFLSWIVGSDDQKTTTTTSLVGNDQILKPTPTIVISSENINMDDSSPANPQPTQYPSEPRPATVSPELKKGLEGQKLRRLGPWPGFVKDLNKKLEFAKYDDRCWKEMTGCAGGLEELWDMYLESYE